VWETHTLGGVTGIKRCLGAAAIPHDTSYAHDENSPLLLVPPPKHAASLQKRAHEAGRGTDNIGSVWLKMTQETPAGIPGDATPTTPQRKQRVKSRQGGRFDVGDSAHSRESGESSSTSSSRGEEQSTGEEEDSERAGQAEEYAAQARLLFKSSRIGADEQLVGDFGCAFRRPPLARLYGRLFVFQRNAAFHAALFGATAVAKVLPLCEIESVTAAAEPMRLIYDGIRVTMRGTGKQYLFGAFSVRDEALKCLRESVERCRGEAAASGDAQAPPDDDDDDAGSEMGDMDDADTGGGGAQEYRTTKEAASVLSAPTVAVCVLHKLDSFQIQETAPADPPDMEALAIGESGATSVHLGARPEACFALFFAEGSQFIQTFRTSRGDWDVRVGPWTDWKQVTGPGRLRTVQFHSPTNTSFPGAPKQTRVEETQRFRFYLSSSDGGSDDASSSGGGGGTAKTVLLDSTMAMPDVPYGDRFTLETRMVLSPSGCTASNAKSCGTEIRVLYKCHWVKSVPLVKRQVDKQSRDSMTQAYKRMCELMGHYLAGTDTRKLLFDGSAGASDSKASGDSAGPHRRRGMTGPARSMPGDEGPAHGKETVSVVAQHEAEQALPPSRVPMVALVLALVALAMLLQGMVAYRLGRRAGRRGD
jgi:hypothetical protein